MIRIYGPIGLALICAAPLFAQNAKLAPDASVRDYAVPIQHGQRFQAATIEEITYIIEMKFLEGKGLEEPSMARLAAASAASRTTRSNLQEIVPPASVTIPSTADDAPAPQPHPTQQPTAQRTEAAPRAEVVLRSEDDDLWEDAGKQPSVTVIAAPKLAVVADRAATIQIKSEQIFSFLEPLGSGKFEVRHSKPQELGMSLTLAVQRPDAKSPFVELSPLEVHMSTLDGREPVEGLDLDVGKPIVATRSLSTTARVKLGAIRKVILPAGPKSQAILLLRVTQTGKS